MIDTASDPAAVGPAEEGLWLLQELAGGLAISNLTMELRLPRAVDKEILKESMAFLIRRHPGLRLVFRLRAGTVYRQQAPFQHLRGVVESSRVSDDEALHALLLRAAGTAFELQTGPLIRLAHGQLPDGTGAMALVVHHLTADGSTLRVLAEELLACITSLRADGSLPELPPPPPWSPPPAPSPESVAYWQEHVRDYEPSSATLDAAKPASDDPSFRTGRVIRRLSPPAADAVRRLRRRLRATDHIVLLSAYYVDLIRHGAGRDLVVGMLTSTRGPQDRLGVGFRVNTVPMRLTVDPAASFADVVATARSAMLACLPHIGAPYEALLREKVTFAAPGDWWHTRLFRHLFNFRLADSVEISTSGGVTIEELHHGLGQHDLELNLERHGDDLLAKLVYGHDAHDEPFAEALLARFEHILVNAGSHPDLPINEYDLRTAHDRAVLAAANDTDRVWPAPDTVAAQIAQQAALRPDAVAVLGADDAMTYAQLMSAAEVTRQLLTEAGVAPGDVVALSARRGARTAAGVLGIWACGAAYLPLDPTHPRHRLAFQLDELGCRVVVGAADLDPELVRGRTAIAVPDGRQCPPVVPSPAAEPAPDDLAYVIYTSGSTGRPKGVRLTHRNLSNVVRHFRTLLDLDESTTGLWLTTFSFDISALELLMPLNTGGTVVIVEDDSRATPEAVLGLIERRDVDLIQATPTSWRLFGPLAAGRLTGRRVLCGGEPLSPDLAEVLTQTGAQVYNVYGPTETTIWSTVAPVAGPVERPVPVGRPLANTRVVVMDEHGLPLPPFIKGELCIAGAGVADGYWNRPQLTADRFVDFAEVGRCYRTGDRASWTAGGTLLLHGRADRQVKIRGHRIELGELEHALTGHPDVKAACVITYPDGGDMWLVAYVEPAHTGLTAETVWHHAAEQLPAYALPERVVVIDRLPTTPNHKVDIAALSDRVAADIARSPVETTAAAGTDDSLVTTLLQAWRSVLGRPEVHQDSHFFLSGGNSLMALRLIAEIHRATQHRIRLLTLFSAPTPLRLAATLRSASVSERLPDPVPAPKG